MKPYCWTPRTARRASPPRCWGPGNPAYTWAPHTLLCWIAPCCYWNLTRESFLSQHLRHCCDPIDIYVCIYVCMMYACIQAVFMFMYVCCSMKIRLPWRLEILVVTECMYVCTVCMYVLYVCMYVIWYVYVWIHVCTYQKLDDDIADICFRWAVRNVWLLLQELEFHFQKVRVHHLHTEIPTLRITGMQ